MAEFYFIDTREGAKNDEPFAIHNADVAKVWTREFNNGEGPFKPVDPDVKFGINRHDLKMAGENTAEKQAAAAEHNQTLIDVDNPYKEMSQKDLQDELEARGIDYKKSGPESAKDFYIGQLLEDDKK